MSTKGSNKQNSSDVLIKIMELSRIKGEIKREAKETLDKSKSLEGELDEHIKDYTNNLFNLKIFFIGVIIAFLTNIIANFTSIFIETIFKMNSKLFIVFITSCTFCIYILCRYLVVILKNRQSVSLYSLKKKHGQISSEIENLTLRIKDLGVEFNKVASEIYPEKPEILIEPDDL